MLPQLFVLATGMLGRLLCRAIELGMLQQLHPWRPISVFSLYADNVILFFHPSQVDIFSCLGVPRAFRLIS